jgi:hypothetical protein
MSDILAVAVPIFLPSSQKAPHAEEILINKTMHIATGPDRIKPILFQKWHGQN